MELVTKTITWEEEAGLLGIEKLSNGYVLAVGSGSMKQSVSLPLTKRDDQGYLLIRDKCSLCKTCWIYMGGPAAGTCLYGGPFQGYVKVEETISVEADKEQGEGTTPP